MIDLSLVSYPAYDKPEISLSLFYPRKEPDSSSEDESDCLMIPVPENTVLSGRFHRSGEECPTILFFHGNGEIAADYCDIGGHYRRMGINFLPVDYRGYGRSTGSPTVTAMMRDAHVIFSHVKAWLKERGFSGPLVVMGRSLGSAPVLEIAFHYGERIAGLIIESGFARLIPLLRLLGIDGHGLTEEAGPQNLTRIRTVTVPTLIIHAEYDRIIPYSEGKELYEASPSRDKMFLKIQGADHNDIFFKGMNEYLNALETFKKIVMNRQAG